MVDIVERLRRKGERVGIPCPDGIEGCLVYHFKIKTDPDCAEAADEIERLRDKYDKMLGASAIFQTMIHNSLFVFEKTVDDIQQKESE